MIEEMPSDAPEPKRITIPYVPRKHFLGLHRSTKRWKLVVAHRRAGKSVAEINEEIKQALTNPRAYPPPRYAYIGPTFAQTKDLIWEYLKHYTGVLPGVSYSESDLQCTLPNGALINLYGGSSAYERMRGLYFDGVVMDEFPLLNPNVLSTVVRPCLADYRGWAIVSGTSNGDDHFHELKKKWERDEDCDIFIIPVTKTDALHPDEVIEMTKDMTADEFAREMLCSFAAPVEGAYYGDILNKLEAADRIMAVPYDPSTSVFTWWDLGIDDNTVIWFVQRVGRELHIIDHLSDTGKGLDFYAQALKAKGYTYALHILPHDIKARELGTGRSRFEVLMELLGDVWPCPIHRVEDGIAATRTVLPLCYFDKEKTEAGRASLRNYHRGASGQPVHNWASHDADAFRVGSVSLNQVVGFISSSNVVSMRGGRLRRKIRGLA